MATPSMERITRRSARSGRLGPNPAAGRSAPSIQSYRVKVGKRVVPVLELREVDLRFVSPGDMNRVFHAVWTVVNGPSSNAVVRRWAAKLYPHVRELHTKQLSALAADEAVAVFRSWMGMHCDAVETPQIDDLRKKVSLAVEATLKPVLEVGEAGSDQETEPSSETLAFGEADAPSPDLRAALALLRQRQDVSIGEILRLPEMLSPDDFGGRIDLSRQRLNQWRQEGRVLAIEGAKRGFRYPDWQVGRDGRIFSAVVEVQKVFGAPLPAYRFLTTPLELLGGRAPRDLLGGAEEGRITGLAEAAVRGDYL